MWLGGGGPGREQKGYTLHDIRNTYMLHASGQWAAS